MKSTSANDIKAMVHVLQIIVYMYSSGKMNRMDNDACIVYVRVREGALILHFQLNDMYIMFQANMKSTNDAGSSTKAMMHILQIFAYICGSDNTVAFTNSIITQ